MVTLKKSRINLVLPRIKNDIRHTQIFTTIHVLFTRDICRYAEADCMTISIEKHYAELSSRWQRARQASLQTETPNPHNTVETESEVFERLSPDERNQALRAVFKNSAKLGASFSSFLKVTLELGDIQALLNVVGNSIPCLHRTQTHVAEGLVLERMPCESKLCDFYRESIDGLVIGLSEEVTFARHRSGGHGDAVCRDALFIGRESTLRFGALPEDFFTALKPVFEKFQRLKLNLDVHGLSEGTVFYTLSRKGEPLCGASSNMFHDLFTSEIKKISASYSVKDISPAAVFVEKA